jgi:hypothetical protein
MPKSVLTLVRSRGVTSEVYKVDVGDVNCVMASNGVSQVDHSNCGGNTYG